MGDSNADMGDSELAVGPAASNPRRMKVAFAVAAGSFAQVSTASCEACLSLLSSPKAAAAGTELDAVEGLVIHVSRG